MKPELIEQREHDDYAAGRLTEFTARCRERGLAITPQRLAIIRALLSSAQHPTADAVYEVVRREHPHISRATVHRTLDVLCDAGEARKVTVLHDSARYDGNVAPHHHVICVRCHRIADVSIPDADARLLSACTNIGDFQILGASVEIQAVCADCRGEHDR
jgi:Fur family transcriptional regulator, peroxide stress response regulator